MYKFQHPNIFQTFHRKHQINSQSSRDKKSAAIFSAIVQAFYLISIAKDVQKHKNPWSTIRHETDIYFVTW